MKDDLETAHSYCQAVARREARNFYYGFLLLPAEQRRGICAAYTFAHECDEIVDGGTAGQAGARLPEYRESLDACLLGRPVGPSFNALWDTVERFQVPHVYLRELIEGVEMDLTARRFASFAELRRYCYLVASTIGLVCLHIFKYDGSEKAREQAIDLGIAFQLTNILRDIREDAARGRVYLPLEDMERFGYGEQDLMESRSTPSFRQLVRFEAERARDYYRSGRQVLKHLPRRPRACVGAMAAIYGRILDDISRRPDAVLRQRVSLSARQKLALASRELVRSLAS